MASTRRCARPKPQRRLVNLSRHRKSEDAVAPGSNYKDMLATKASVEAVEASGHTKGKDEAAACSNYAEMLDTRAAVGVVSTSRPSRRTKDTDEAGTTRRCSRRTL